MIKIRYGHHRNIDNIYFGSGWTGLLYIDTVPKGNERRYINNVEEKNGIDIVKSKIVQEVFVARFLASEGQIRVLEKLPLLSNVRITVDDFDEEKVYNVKFEVTDWFSGGAYGKCELKYAVNTYVDKHAI